MEKILQQFSLTLIAGEIEKRKNEIAQSKNSLNNLKISKGKLLDRKKYVENRQSLTYNDKEEVKRIQESLQEKEKEEKKISEDLTLSEKSFSQFSKMRENILNDKKISKISNLTTT